MGTELRQESWGPACYQPGYNWARGTARTCRVHRMLGRAEPAATLAVLHRVMCCMLSDVSRVGEHRLPARRAKRDASQLSASFKATRGRRAARCVRLVARLGVHAGANTGT